MPFTAAIRKYSSVRAFLIAFCVAGPVAIASPITAQNLPLLSGGAGFITITTGGNTTYLPVLSPLIAAPLGNHVLVESRAMILDSFFPKGSGQSGYKHDLFMGLTYLQADFIANPHLTVVAGEFLTPFGTYNERLTPIWIGNFTDAPLIYPIGTMNTGSSVGGMLRGSAISSSRASLDYAAYYSASSTNQNFSAQRAGGGRASVYIPDAHLEAGASFGHRIEGKDANFEGIHLWWEPANSSFRLRSEYAHGPHSSGYWIEGDYRRSRFDGGGSFLAHVEPVLRMQQIFRSSPDSGDGLPSTDAKRLDFGIDIRLPHEVRMNTSYSRQFMETRDENIWQTGLVYRFLFPAWKGK